MQTPGLARRSVRANVDLAQTWWGVPRRERKARTAAALEAMHADHLARRPALALSGGERRRVHLARAVALQPDVLLLDEPFAGLDAETQAALRDDTASALRTSAGAVVLVVHDRAEAWALADRMILLFDGQVAAEGRPQELLERPPTPAVAKFLGYDGELRTGSDVVLTRAAHVRLDPDGPIGGHVRRVVPIEDGGRVEIETPAGRLQALAAFPLPSVGEEVRVSLVGGVRFES
jgi:ABC-type sulfate/molybdate transport systems ATPase subunit